MSSKRPYLLRGLHQWISDDGFTPYIIIDATHQRVEVPPQYIDDGRIVLNIATIATQGLKIDNQNIEFNARFSGVTRHIKAPISAVLAIYARETGEGMVFPEENENDTPPIPEDEIKQTGNIQQMPNMPFQVITSIDTSQKKAIDEQNNDNNEPPPSTSPPAGKRGKPDLKVVK